LKFANDEVYFKYLLDQILCVFFYIASSCN